MTSVWFEVAKILLFCVVCECTEVETTTQLSPSTRSEYLNDFKAVGPFTNVSSGVSSEKILIKGTNRLVILNFQFDGNVSDVQFRVGRGRTITDNSTLVEPQFMSKSSVQDVELTMPSGLTVEDVDWLAVWDAKLDKHLGYVYLKNIPEFPPQTFGLKDEVKSGPIVLLDKKTLYVPSFQYSGGHENVRFWVGNGTEPGPDGVPIPDENGTSNNLRVYEGQTIYLHLPDNITTDNIDYFGVWSVDENLSLGSVPIKGIEGVPIKRIDGVPNSPDSTERFRLIVPKCCPNSSILTEKGCQNIDSIVFEPKFKVFDHNETHFENVSIKLELITFVPYIAPPDCIKYPLNESNEEFALLKNGSLLVKGKANTGILAQTQFCLEYLETEMSILVCAPKVETYVAMFYVYVTFAIISTGCFFSTFLIYVFWMKFEDVHRKFFSGYAFAMTVAFVALSVVQIGGVENIACELLGFFFQIFIIASFVVLAILCVDIYIIIKHDNADVYQNKRYYSYLGTAIIVPLVSSIISLSTGLVPDVPNSFFKPQFQKNNCYFDVEQQNLPLFYIFIVLPMVVSVVFLVLSKLKIVSNDKDIGRIWDGRLYKFMWRKHAIISLISALWCIETVIREINGGASILLAVDIIEAVQGVCVLLLFVLNKQTRIILNKRIKARKRKQKPASIEQDLMIALNGIS